MNTQHIIDRHIDRLFDRDGCPDIFSGETIAELKDVIDRKLNQLDLSTLRIYVFEDSTTLPGKVTLRPLTV